MSKYGESALPFQAIGYKQAVQVIRQNSSPAVALRAIQQAHRNYAKRQVTWLRREPDVRRLEGFGDDPSMQKIAIDMVASEPVAS